MAKAVSGVHKHVVSDVLFMRRCIRCPDLHCRGTARPGYPNREKMWRKWGEAQISEMMISIPPTHAHLYLFSSPTLLFNNAREWSR